LQDTQKNSESCPSNQVSAAAMTSVSDLPIVFSVQRTGGSPAGPDPENRVGHQDTGRASRPVSSGLQVSGEPGHVVQEQDNMDELPAVFFLQNVVQLNQ